MVKAHRAYTLTELVVTIGILIVLAALLFPVVSKARAVLQASPCMSNMHQLGMWLLLYLQDYNYTSIRDTF